MTLHKNHSNKKRLSTIENQEDAGDSELESIRLINADFHHNNVEKKKGSSKMLILYNLDPQNRNDQFAEAYKTPNNGMRSVQKMQSHYKSDA